MATVPSDQPPSTAELADPRIEVDPAPPGPEIVPEPNEDGQEVDSAYGDTVSAYSTSLASSIRQYRVEHGRTYANYGKVDYWGSNDEETQDQQDLGNHVYSLGFRGKMYLAPTESPKNVLDLGCGTGLWCITLADAHPDAIVKGIDLSPIQPTYVPQNLKFEVDDFTSDWVNSHAKYDLIHAREIIGTTADWTGLYKKAFDSLSPGGWFEHTEPEYVQVESFDPPLADDHPFVQIVTSFKKIGEQAGLDFFPGRKLKGYLEEVGFINVTEVVLKFPVRGWAKDPQLKELGRWNHVRTHLGVKDWVTRSLTNFLGYTEDEVTVFLARYRAECRNQNIHPFNPVVTVYGQKPPAKASEE